MTNYLANSWTPTAGCQRCAKNKIDLSTIEVILFFHHMLQKNRVCKNNRCTCALCMTVVAYRRVAYVCLLSCRTVTFRWFTSRCISNTPRRFWIASLRCWPRKNIPRIACMSSSTTWWVHMGGDMLFSRTSDLATAQSNSHFSLLLCLVFVFIFCPVLGVFRSSIIPRTWTRFYRSTETATDRQQYCRLSNSWLRTELVTWPCKKQRLIMPTRSQTNTALGGWHVN